MDSPKLSHVDDRSNPQMVDVSPKNATQRTARARALVWFPPAVAASLGLESARPGDDLTGPKGTVFQTAIIAGIMGAKQTANLIPLCHPLPLDKVHVELSIIGEGLVEILTECRTTHKTGVEMEALTAASIAALTVYDMCKALSHQIEIRSIALVSKTGGKSDYGQA